MRIPSSATQLAKLAAQASAGNPAAPKPGAALAQAALNASPLQGLPPRLGVQQPNHPPRKQHIGKLIAQLAHQASADVPPAAFQPRPQIQSASQMFGHLQGPASAGAPPLHFKPRPQIQFHSSAQFAHAHPALPSVQAPAPAVPTQAAAPAAAAHLADDRFAAERLSAMAPPANAKFQKTTGMMAQYDGEQTGKVWGTKVAYLDEQQRQQYKLSVHDGKIYDAKGELFDTASAATVLGGGKAIFVMDHDGNMYASTSHAVGKFHHSSFLGGQPVAAAGEIEVHNGEVTVVNRKSGHYRPTESQLNQVAEHLSSLGLSNFAIDQKV
jgi:hypothetical protein